MKKISEGIIRIKSLGSTTEIVLHAEKDGSEMLQESWPAARVEQAKLVNVGLSAQHRADG